MAIRAPDGANNVLIKIKETNLPANDHLDDSLGQSNARKYRHQRKSEEHLEEGCHKSEEGTTARGSVENPSQSPKSRSQVEQEHCAKRVLYYVVQATIAFLKIFKIEEGLHENSSSNVGDAKKE